MMTMDHPPRLLDLRATVTERGFIVQAHVDGLPGSSGDGPSLRTHILQMCTVLSGKVTRIEEYLSPEDPRARPSSRAQLDSDRQ
jgi:hypothetical protein